MRGIWGEEYYDYNYHRNATVISDCVALSLAEGKLLTASSAVLLVPAMPENQRSRRLISS